MRGFSARQIVTVVVAVCATVVLTPTAIWAASSSLVRISDGSGKVAQVDPTGHLYITDGKGPLTVDGGVKVTNGSSSLKVSGTVDARVATPAHPWNTVNGVNLSAGNPSAVLYSGIVGTRLNITSFTYASDGSTPGTISLNLQVYVSDSAAGDCTTLTGSDVRRGGTLRGHRAGRQHDQPGLPVPARLHPVRRHGVALLRQGQRDGAERIRPAHRCERVPLLRPRRCLERRSSECDDLERCRCDTPWCPCISQDRAWR